MKSDKLTESDRAWLCSCSSYAKVKKPELTVMATSEVAIMLHNLRSDIEDLEVRLVVDELSKLLDDVEEKLGEDNDVYCELAYDFQNINDDIKHMRGRLLDVLKN